MNGGFILESVPIKRPFVQHPGDFAGVRSSVSTPTASAQLSVFHRRLGRFNSNFRRPYRIINTGEFPQRPQKSTRKLGPKPLDSIPSRFPGPNPSPNVRLRIPLR
jgi:hypothetical protein